MIKSMYSGISGMNAQQRKLDVIGNNIANSGTTAFKSSSVTFQDSMRETIGRGSGPVMMTGGTNPKQIGMGVKLQSINVNTGQGSMNPTGRPLDNAIDGNGFFIVAKGPMNGEISTDAGTTVGAEKAMESYYTRDGEFKRDNLGNLVTPNGYRVMGYISSDANRDIDATTGKIKLDFVDANKKAEDLNFQKKLEPLAIPEEIGGQKILGYTIEKDGIIKATLADNTVSVLGQVAMASFVNDSGLDFVGQNMVLPSVNSGQAVIRPSKSEKSLNENAYGSIINGMLEMSNVDLAVEFTEMIVASRSFQACSKVITTGDEILQELVNLKR